MKQRLTRQKIRFSQQAATAIKKLIQQNSEQQLAGLTPTERCDILSNILVERHGNGSSLKVNIVTKQAVETEFGTSTKPARPWIKKLQRSLASPVKTVLAQLLTPKK